MKLRKRVLSLVLVMMTLLSVAVFVSADETITHVVSADEEKLIPAVDYTSTDNKNGTRDDCTVNGVSTYIPISTKETNLGSSSGLNNIYKLNVEQAGQYRLTAWLGRTKKYVSADVCVMSGKDVIARGISSIGTTGIKNAQGVTTSLFNLSGGIQDFHLRIHAVNDDPYKYADDYLYFFCFELERVDTTKASAVVSANQKNTLEVENYIYRDAGVTTSSDTVSITSGNTASFYADVETAGNYAFAINYKTADGTGVKVNSLTATVYDNTLVPTNGGFLTHTLGISTLNAGKNKIFIKPDKNLEIDKIYINKVSDASTPAEINSATTADEMQAAISSLESAINSELTDAMNAIFYKVPVYNRLLDSEYASLSEFVNEYNEAILSEYNQPWITLYIDGNKKLELETGDIKFTASTGYLPKGSTMIAALYENLENNLKTLHNFAICENISGNTSDFKFGDTEIKSNGSYTLKFYYWDGLKNVVPIEPFRSIYEQIYVSNSGSDTTGDGTEGKPYATIQEALNKVNRINEYQWGDIIVNVGGGAYTLDNTLTINETYSGKNGYNVIIRGDKNNQPLISGGVKVTGWNVDSGKIWKAPLSGMDYVRNLYINGYPAVMARSDRHYNTATTDSNNSSFTISKSELGMKLENSPVGMELVWPVGFENHITPVTGYGVDGDDVSFYINSGLMQKRGDSDFASGALFYLQNAKELINKPGEFYYDKEYIYYYPYDYEDMKTADVYVGNVEGMVKVAGSSNTSKVSNITFENLSFRYGAYNFISKYGYIGSQTDGVLVPFDWSNNTIGYKAQFEVDNADNINIKGCEFACLGSAAVSMINSVSNSKIEGNIIRDISGTGIRIGHPTHNRERAGIEVCRNIDITNNVIRRIAGEMFNNCAITVYYEKFINILHNDIENVPYSGMSIGWGWGGGAPYDCSDIDISYNRIQNVMNVLTDGGGVYTLGPLKNTKISNNYIADHNAGRGGLIYNDEGSEYIEIFNNVALDGLMTHNLNDPKGNLKVYNNYSDTGKHAKIPEGRNIEFAEYKKVQGKGEELTGEALNIYRKSGLEPAYANLLDKAGIELPQGYTSRFKLPEPAPTEETVLLALDYDYETSSPDLEMIEDADCTGVVIDGEQYVNYKLDIPEDGYYRIMLRAIGDSDAYDSVKISGDASEIKMRVYQGANSEIKTTNLAIFNTDYYDYRICTAKFKKGQQNLTISTLDSTNRVIIKEIKYANLLHDIKPSGINVLKIKNYKTVEGLNNNTYENADPTTYSSTGSDIRVVGCVVTPANKSTTLTYDIYVNEEGTYKINAASWLKNSATYKVTVDGNEITKTSPSYTSLKKTDVTTVGNINLPAGKSTLTFTCTSSSAVYMFYLTLEKQ